MRHYLSNSYALLQASDDCADCMVCPQKLYLDITQDCNLWCRMCRDERSVSGRTMPLALFQRLVDETSPFVRSYSLFNWGEPLLLKDFRDRVRYVNRKKRPDCRVDISTNGMLLDSGMIDFLVKENVSVAISVDSADPATFEAIRRGARFDAVMRNAGNVARAAADFPPEYSPSFYVSIQKENQNAILPIAQLAHALGIRRFGCGIVTSPEAYAASQDEALCQELERTYRYLNENGMFLDVYPTKVGPYVLVGDQYHDASGYIVSTVCNAPLVSATVSYSGDVFLCCNIGDCVGNIADGSFLALWRSEQYNRLRRAVNNPTCMPDHCRRCAWFKRN